MKFKFYALWLSVICVIVFVIQILVPGFIDLFVLNSSAYTQIWRFVTPIFLHGSLQHIVFNLVALLIFGGMLEALIGGKKFLIVFFVTGIIANLVSVNFYTSSLGASGAIFGVIGALILVRPTLAVWAFGFPMPVFLAGIIWVLIDIFGIFNPGEVANLAHLSGIFSGLVLGLFYRDWTKKQKRQTEVKLDESYVRRWEDYYMRDI